MKHEEFVKFDAKIRLRKVGGYLVIPKNIMKKMNAEVGDIVEIKFSDCPTKTGTWIHSTTIQTPPSVYLRKIDLMAIGIDPNGDVIEKQVIMKVVIKKLKDRTEPMFFTINPKE